MCAIPGWTRRNPSCRPIPNSGSTTRNVVAPSPPITPCVIHRSDHGEALGERAHWGKSNLYGECTQVPLVIAGPDVPAGTTCDTPVNLIDLAPTFLSAFGLTDAL